MHGPKNKQFIIYFAWNIDNAVTQAPNRQNVDVTKKKVLPTEVSCGAIVNILSVLGTALSTYGFQVCKFCVYPPFYS